MASKFNRLLEYSALYFFDRVERCSLTLLVLASCERLENNLLGELFFYDLKY
jgi:hypothetical protein